MIEACPAEMVRTEPLRAWRFAELPAWWRLVLLLPVLPAEVLLLTLRYSADALYQQSGAWAGVLAFSPQMLKAFLAAGAATLLFGGVRLWRELQSTVAEKPLALPWWSYLAGHLAVFLAFAALTGGLFEGGLLAVHPGLWVTAWFVLGLLTFASWLAAVIPPSAWVRMARVAAWPLLGGCAAGLVAWQLGTAARTLWAPLARATFGLVSVLLGLTGAEVISDPNELTLGTETFAVYVAPECSGYEGMGLILVFLAAYVAMFRSYLRFPQVFILFPVGVVLIWLANAVRITLLLVIGSAGAEAIALGGFHSQAGWLAFNALALGFVGLTTRMRFFQRGTAVSPSGRVLDPTVAYLAPWLAILTVSLVLGAFTAGFDWFYPVRVLVAAVVLYACRSACGRWDGSVSWLAVGLGVVVFGAWLLLAPRDMLAGSGPPTEWTAAGPAWAMLWLVFRVAGSVLTVPLAEELAFRGYLTRRLVSNDFQALPLGRMTLVSVVASSVLFGLLHGRCWPAGIVAGFLFALALRHRGRLADSVIAHATANALLCAYVLSTGNWSLWN
jgi:exosortase E/protease (VPEID-CTERM system)